MTEKYGVEQEDQPLTKTSSTTPPACPVCDALLRPVDETGVSLCPNCGSKPFEKKVVRDG